MTAVLLIGVSFLIGSFPSGLVLAQMFADQDVRQAGSGNIGAANVARVAGARVGIAVAVLDILKGAMPVWIGTALGLSPTALALVALAAVLGHDFSVFLRFRGGKGVATSVGIALALAPIATVFAMLTWAVMLLLSRYSSLASLLALALLGAFMLVTHQPAAYVVLALILFVLAALKHWENILRLAQGTEPRFRRRAADGV